jgi:hypothetical protein
MDLLRFIFGSFAFVIESVMGCMTSIIMILFLMCALGALVECPKMF